jgi:hypothetical protein
MPDLDAVMGYFDDELAQLVAAAKKEQKEQKEREAASTN